MNIEEVAETLKWLASHVLLSYKTTWEIFMESEIKDKFKFEEVVEYIKK